MVNRKKRVLLFNYYYLPGIKSGGPVKSAKTVVDSCCDEFDFYIVCYNHDFASKDVYADIAPGWNTVGNSKVLYMRDGEYDYSFKRLKKLFEDVQPDLIWFPGVLVPKIKWQTVIIAKKMRIPVLFSPRGEVCADRVAIKALKKRPYLAFVKTFKLYNDGFFQSTCDDETTGIKRFLGINDNRIYEVTNIPEKASENLVFYEKTPGTVKAVFISRVHKVKNLLYALKVMKEIKDIDIQFDIYGPIESEEYWNDCKKCIDELPANISVSYKKVLEQNEVGDTFMHYDCFVFPTINENYGHVIAEALGNGCIPIISRGTTPWDDVDNVAGFACPLGDPKAYIRALHEVAALDTDGIKAAKNKCVEYYTYKLLKSNAVVGHKNMFNDIIARYKESD